MGTYKKFTLKQFKFFLYQAGVSSLSDITEEWLGEGKISQEHIFKVSTRNKSLDIIIYSSVDMRDGKDRSCGSDAVRMVFRWKTSKGERYRRIGKRYRTTNVFQNVAYTINQAQGEAFNFDPQEFGPTLEEALANC